MIGDKAQYSKYLIVAKWQSGNVAICCAYDSPTLTANDET